MFDARSTGLMLMGTASAGFIGTPSELLPSVTFFPALGLFLMGAFKFVKANGAEMAKADKRAVRRVNPALRQNKQAQAHAERLAAKRGGALSALNDQDAEAAARLASGYASTAAIEIDTNDDDLVVATDVSFPVEFQSGDALADQLLKLNELMSQGILTEEEYAVAKSKLLG
jgi:hypothetical protein